MIRVSSLSKENHVFLNIDEVLDEKADDVQVLYQSFINRDDRVDLFIKPLDQDLQKYSTQSISKVMENFRDTNPTSSNTVNHGNSNSNAQSSLVLMNTYRKLHGQIINYFKEERVWHGPSKSPYQPTSNPFDKSTIIPVENFINNYQIYKERVLPKHESYMIDNGKVLAIFDNDYSTTLSNLAKSMVGEVCWNKKLVIFAEHWHAFHNGGPRKVISYLVSALKFVGKEFKVTDDLLDPTIASADFIYSYHPYKYRELIKKIKLGLKKNQINDNLKIFLGPIIANTLLEEQYVELKNRATFLAASHWVKRVDYDPHLQKHGVNVLVHPTPVNTKIWSPQEHVPDRRDILFYGKLCPENALLLTQETERMIKAHSYFAHSQIHTVKYETKYTEADFLKLLREKIGVAVVCGQTETQGLAIQEMLSLNIPVFVLWKTSNPQVAYEPSTAPYFLPGMTGTICSYADFTKEFPPFLQMVADHKFSPRQFVVELFNYFDNVVDFMKLLCFGENRFNPTENYLKELSRLNRTFVQE